MIHPTIDDALTAIIHAVERDIAPHVTDDYAASVTRTVVQMLRSVQVRASQEPELLAADNRELRALLTDLLERLPEAVRADVGAAVDNPPGIASMADLSADALRLRAALTRVINAVPEATDPTREAVRTYLRHHLDREKVWMQDAFTGPRR
jgi:hypothetical protein